jgi:hypothetical protein
MALRYGARCAWRAAATSRESSQGVVSLMDCSVSSNSWPEEPGDTCVTWLLAIGGGALGCRCPGGWQPRFASHPPDIATVGFALSNSLNMCPGGVTST